MRNTATNEYGYIEDEFKENKVKENDIKEHKIKKHKANESTKHGLKAVRRYKNPQYPDWDQIKTDPSLLKNIPIRWKENLTVGVAVSTLMLVSLAACKQTDEKKPSTPQNMKALSTSQTMNVAAPFFKHGEGRGAYGCSSVVPPAYLSEEEALQIINDEVKKDGLVFQKGNSKLSNIDIPVTKLSLEPEEMNGENKPINFKTKKGTLELDGQDGNKQISFEFVSVADYIAWAGGAGAERMSTVEEYLTADAARTLANSFKDKPDQQRIGVFYDPIAFKDEMLKEMEGKDEKERMKMLKDASSQNLKEQVRDFVQWLKAQGVI